MSNVFLKLSENTENDQKAYILMQSGTELKEKILKKLHCQWTLKTFAQKIVWKVKLYMVHQLTKTILFRKTSRVILTAFW